MRESPWSSAIVMEPAPLLEIMERNVSILEMAKVPRVGVPPPEYNQFF